MQPCNIVALADSIARLQKENLWRNEKNQVDHDPFARLADYNRGLGDEVILMDSEILLRRREIETKTAQLQLLETEIRKLADERLHLRRHLSKDKRFAARSFAKLQRERTELVDRVRQLRIDRLLTEKIQLLRANSNLVRAIDVLEDDSRLDKRAALERLLRDMDERITGLAQDNVLHASELFGELSDRTDVDAANIDAERIEELETKRPGRVEADRVRQAFLDREEVEREYREQERRFEWEREQAQT
jgi:hypothetical protein